MYLCDPICNVLNFSVLFIIPVANMMCRDIVLRNPIPLMCMRSKKICDLLVLITDGFGNNFYLNRLHIFDLAPNCLGF